MATDRVQLSPGVYVIANELHIDIAELLAANGIEPTADNAEVIERLARECFAQLGLPVGVVDGW